MGLESRPRTPAIHRAMAVLDAISSSRARTPATIATTLALAKSSVSDLLETLEAEGLVSRSTDGKLQTGGRWAALADPSGDVDRLLRGCSRVHELDGHTIAVSRLVGTRVLCLDVRTGQHPLPLTPRPGQYSPAADSAAAAALLSATSDTGAIELLAGYAGHEGRVTDDISQLLALRRGQRPGGVVQLRSTSGVQLAGALPEATAALIVHLPERLAQPALTRKIARAITVVIGELRAARPKP